ncbi:hypothetical protein C8F04DRAFT_1065682 [Mycena alexandri]|uniref:Uncharacterized protein n=1 Tax=Mycena alexandri TaxID=1745969 RepID=A0AAD6TGK2_9AGAR|nr:hypothetical protein C8F04DRAFT_1065682 [Mycena alexandri]
MMKIPIVATLKRIPLRSVIVAVAVAFSQSPYFRPQSISSPFLYLSIGFSMHSIAFTAIAGYSAIAQERRGRDSHSDLAPYSLPRHLSQFVSPLAYTFGAAAFMQTEKLGSSLFFRGILRTLQTVFPYSALLFALEYLPIIIMRLIMRLPLEPYKTMWYLGTTLAPRIFLHPFLWLVYVEAMNFEMPSFGPGSFMIQDIVRILASRLSWCYKQLGMVTYATIAIWKITDIATAYFYHRALTNIRAFTDLRVPSQPLIPGGIIHFLLYPLSFPVAMIVNHCMYTAQSVSAGATTSVVAIGQITLAVGALCVYDFLAYWFLNSLLLRRAGTVPKPFGGWMTSLMRWDRWVTTPLDEMARGVFAFGSAAALNEKQEEYKKGL